MRRCNTQRAILFLEICMHACFSLIDSCPQRIKYFAPGEGWATVLHYCCASAPRPPVRANTQHVSLLRRARCRPPNERDERGVCKGLETLYERR